MRSRGARFELRLEGRPQGPLPLLEGNLLAPADCPNLPRLLGELFLFAAQSLCKGLFRLLLLGNLLLGSACEFLLALFLGRFRVAAQLRGSQQHLPCDLLLFLLRRFFRRQFLARQHSGAADRHPLRQEQRTGRAHRSGARGKAGQEAHHLPPQPVREDGRSRRIISAKLLRCRALSARISPSDQP